MSNRCTGIRFRKEEFVDLYFKQEKSLRESAKIMCIDAHSIRYHAKTNWNIKLRSRRNALRLASEKGKMGKSGELNGNYKNGLGNRFGKYGITEDIFYEMLESQNKKCKICDCNLDKSAHIDHCHKSGNVRGLLCKWCNVGLGSFKDNVNSLSKAIEYLNYTIWDNRK